MRSPEVATFYEAMRKALAPKPPPPEEHPVIDTGKAQELIVQYQLREYIELLVRATAALKKALEHMPEDYPERSTYIDNLVVLNLCIAQETLLRRDSQSSSAI
jgi:hypothetical protein